MAANKSSKLPSLGRVFPWLLIVGSAVALVASFILSLDDIEILKNPAFTPNCNLDPVLSCGSVMQAHESAIFGFPNSWIGLMTFAAVLTVGVALLTGARFTRWFWLTFLGGMLGGLAFAYWMLLESMFRINALCPFCLSVDVVTITITWYLLLHIIDLGHLKLPKSLVRVGTFARRYHVEILISWMLVLIAFILQHFWYYYGQFI